LARVTCKIFLLLAFLHLGGCQQKKSEVPPGPILFLGDSITNHYGLPAHQGFVAYVGHNTNRQVINLGENGSTTTDGLERLGAYLQENPAPPIIVIALGGNDALKRIPLPRREANLQAMIQHAKSRGSQVLLCGVRLPFPFENPNFEALSRIHEVPLLPDILDGVHPNHMQKDKIHPDQEGQRKIAIMVLDALNQNFEL